MGGGRGGGALVQRFGQSSRNAVGIAEHIMIPEADHSVALRFDRGGPIAICLVAMLTAIHLDDHSQAVTAEIGEEAADRDLATKAHFGEMLAQDASHPPFGIGL